MADLICSRSLRFSKHYFWLGSEALDEPTIASYLRSEKSDASHKNAAFASQTGKGLLLFAKRSEDKSSPSGILNLVSAPHPHSRTLLIRLSCEGRRL